MAILTACGGSTRSSDGTSDIDDDVTTLGVDLGGGDIGQQDGNLGADTSADVAEEDAEVDLVEDVPETDLADSGDDVGQDEVGQDDVGQDDVGQDDADLGNDDTGVVNGPPTGLAVLLGPSNPDTTDDLVVQVSGPTDPDGDEISLSFSWTQITAAGESNDRVDITGDTVDRLLTSRAQSWLVTVSANDGNGHTITASDSVVIQNAPPLSPGVRIEPLEPVHGEQLTCVIDTDSTDADGDDVSYEFAWLLRDELDDEFGVIFESETAVVAGIDVVEGDLWRCIVTATDSSGDLSTGRSEAVVETRVFFQDGLIEDRAAPSCLAIMTLVEDHNTDTRQLVDDADGVRWIHPVLDDGGDAYEVYCDLTSEGGGWTLAALIERNLDCSHGDGFWYQGSANWTDDTFSHPNDGHPDGMLTLEVDDYILIPDNVEVAGENCSGSDHSQTTDEGDPQGDAKGQAWTDVAGHDIAFLCGIDDSFSFGEVDEDGFESLSNFFSTAPRTSVSIPGLTDDGSSWAFNHPSGRILRCTDCDDGDAIVMGEVDKDVDGMCRELWVFVR